MKSLTILILLCFISLGLSQSYNCTAAGRFRYGDETCRSYYLCVFYNGAYIKSNYTCPSTLIFEPTSQTCSANATCIENACTNLPARPLYPKIPNPNGPDCRTYIQCVGTPERNPVIMTCPDGLFFNQVLYPAADCSTQGNCS